MESDELGLYLQEISRVPLLSREKERVIGRRARNGDPQAKQQLVEANLRFVVFIAKDYLGFLNGNLTFLDLIQEGNLGLIESIKEFNPAKGKFSTYASYRIRLKITRALHEQRTIRLSSHILEKLNLMKRISSFYLKTENRQPTIEETAQEMKIPVEKVKQFLNLPWAISLEKPVGQDSNTLSDFIADEKAVNPEEVVQEKELKEQIEKVLAFLRPKEEKVLRMRFGIGKKQKCTLQEIGDEFEVTREWIRQIEKKALGKLRHPNKEYLLDGFLE